MYGAIYEGFKIDSLLHSDNDEAIDDACRRFERAWLEQPTLRIERVIGDVEEMVREESVAANREGLLFRIMSELIHVEMDLRANQGDYFRRSEYESRFPDHGDAVESAWLRLKRVYPEHALFTTIIVRDHDERSPQSDFAREPVPQTFGPYEQIEVISEGGFGVVCKGLDTRSGIWVALKFPHGDVIANDFLLNAFQGEAKRVIGLEHPGIVTTLSLEFHDGYVAIAQQLIDGTDLKASMSSFSDPRDAATLVAAIADALAYANRNGVIHRDLKPANILLDRNDQPYISDFGLSIHESDQPFSHRETCGTPPYMSPQLVEGLTRNLDGRTDIWSLGVIFYELLAGKRPFAGMSKDDVFAQIETRDPKPLREIDSSIDRELQRICLKCLEKAARDRYLTADELADDLRHWLAGDQAVPVAAPAIVSRGLRSYSGRDASFFTSLLPGPRDRYGVPASVQFWIDFLTGVEGNVEQQPIGVLCGPSGSGKSSFVKAAVVPRVGETLEVLYVECTREDTEVRLLKAIRGLLADVPDNLSLTELFRGLAAGNWSPQATRIVIILDQFEQRLGVNDRYEQSQIAKAMRHCNSENLMCLLIVRDGFWQALTRFFDALEIDILENQNYRSIDLFDKQHAKKVLRQLGRAAGRLPVEPKPLSRSQENFVESTVNQLAQGHYVVCIQLVVFAEMFKQRQWEQHELRSIGGVHGVGEAFLDYHLGEEPGHSRYFAYRKPAQLALAALLPDEADARIRGSLKTEAELKESVGLERESDFIALLQILEKDLRLISRADPDRGSVDPDDDGLDGTAASSFQLTHDYLVPSIRSWLDELSQKSPSSRAKSKFRSLARNWKATEDDRYLPSAMEFGSMLRFVRYREIGASEKRFFCKASMMYLRRFAAIGGFLVVLGMALFLYSRNKNRQMADSYVSSFVVAEKPEAVSASLEIMYQKPDDCVFLIRQRLESDQLTDAERTRLFLGLAMLKATPERSVIEWLTNQVTVASDSQNEMFMRVFQKHRRESLMLLKSRLESMPGLAPNESEVFFSFARVCACLCALGSSQSIEGVLSDEANFVFRMEFIKSFSIWSPPTVGLEIIEGLRSDRSKGALCLACGALAREKNCQLDSELVSRIRSCGQSKTSAYLVRAAKWACGDSVKTMPIRSSMIRIGEGSEAFEVLDREVLASEMMEFLADPEIPAEIRPLKRLELESQKDGFPASGISHVDAILFCNWLSEREGLTPCYERVNEKYVVPGTAEEQKLMMEKIVDNRLNKWKLIPGSDGYRLPTHRQWELASDVLGILEMTDVQRKVHLPSLGQFGNDGLAAVYEKMPNDHGLFGVYGGVSELCWQEGEHGLLLGEQLVRGGSYETELKYATSPIPGALAYGRFNFRGFRVVRMLP